MSEILVSMVVNATVVDFGLSNERTVFFKLATSPLPASYEDKGIRSALRYAMLYSRSSYRMIFDQEHVDHVRKV
jgi:hypothetical protein